MQIGGAIGAGPDRPVSLKITAMRKALTATAAAAPLLFAAAAGQAQTVIDGEITEPVRTSTANDGEPDDVDVAGDVQVDDGTAVFLDSPNMLTISGSVLIRDADGAVGVILKGGPERSFSLTGTVTVDESYEAPNDDGDTDADGPFAEGSNRIGVLVEGPETFEGDITSSTASGVRVEGNDSTGVRVATDVDGEISLIGSVSALGDNTVGVDVGGDVSEDLTLGGSISTAGEGSRAAVVSGDVEAFETEPGHEVDHVSRHRPLTIGLVSGVARRFVAVSIPAQIGGHDGEALS